MRAVVLELKNCKMGDILEIEGDKAHHLTSVVRVILHEKIKILSGDGQIALAEITGIKNKKIEILISEIQVIKQDECSLEFIVALTKKDSWDLIVKQAVELGVKKLGILHSDYSQNWDLREDRMLRLVESAMEQSNNPFRLEWEIIRGVENIAFSSTSEIILFATEIESKKVPLENHGKRLVLLGPEGGWSPREISYFGEQKNIKIIRINGPIMRTTTAISFAAGFTCRTKYDIL